jgi:hypothetical protein
MIFSDVIRGTAVLALPITAYFAHLTLPIIVLTVIAVSSLSAFFNPALTAFLPQLTRDKSLLQAANGLMETTGRIARIIGPGLVGLLSRQIPLIQYFTVDAFSFFVSAASISRIKPETAFAEHDRQRLGIKATLLSGYHLTRSRFVLTYTVYSGALAGAAWMFVLPLGMTLLIQDKLPSSVGSLGFLISAYGVGHVVSNIIISNFHFYRPERWIFSGRTVAGVGILLLSFSSTLEQMMLSSALTALGGPLTDLGYVNLIQSLCSGRDIARIFRYVMALSQGSLLMVYAVSPKLFQLFAVPTVVASAGALVFASGLFGFAIGNKMDTQH